MSFLNRLRRIWRKGERDSGARVAVAAFGKHPGWDDHIDDPGLNTDLLVGLKRWLYVDGIRSNIDSDAWEQLPPESRLDSFDHVFAWRIEREFVVGHIWSSRDGKGRTKYPMVVCIHGRGLTWSWMVSHALPELADLHQQCRSADSASEVRSLLDSSRSKLEQSARATEESPTVILNSGGALAGLADEAAMGDERVGIYRALYQIEREFKAYRPQAGKSSTFGEVSLRPQHLRVPLCADDPWHGIQRWQSAGAELFARGAPTFTLVPRTGNWLDLIVGIPSASQLQCIRAGLKSIPFVTEVPYNFDEAFRARAEDLLAASRSEVSGGAERRAGEPVRSTR